MAGCKVSSSGRDGGDLGEEGRKWAGVVSWGPITLRSEQQWCRKFFSLYHSVCFWSCNRRFCFFFFKCSLGHCSMTNAGFYYMIWLLIKALLTQHTPNVDLDIHDLFISTLANLETQSELSPDSAVPLSSAGRFGLFQPSILVLRTSILLFWFTIALLST